MRVLMIVPRVVQEAGQQRPLDAGRHYTLSAVLAQSLIDAGAAMQADIVEVGDAPAPVETKVRRRGEARA